MFDQQAVSMLFLFVLVVLFVSTFTVTVFSRNPIAYMWVPAFPLLLAAIAFISMTSQGTPRPIAFAGLDGHAGKVELIAHKTIHKEAIFIFVEGPAAAPRLYSLPWSQEAANKVEQAMERGSALGAGVLVDLPRIGESGVGSDGFEVDFLPAPPKKNGD